MAQAVRSDRAPAPIGPYSQAILSGNELFCSGQVGFDPETGEPATYTHLTLPTIYYVEFAVVAVSL